jgi:2-polyprenyl-3-methyl-5-hydroxy-6-metoxy-1,4-benzoquinol methylase
MELIKRDKCAISGSKDLEKLFTFKNYPLYMGCTDKTINNDIFVDMEWVISKSTGCIQLEKLIPLEILYPENHISPIGKVWQNHHKKFSDFIKKYNPKKGILEIGGAHGYLSKIFHESSNIDWTIIEPNPIPIEGCKAKYIKSIFKKDLLKGLQYDLIVHSHVFEHIYNPCQFLKEISDAINDYQLIIFALPNMHSMLQRNYTNCINFEHTVFLNEEYIEYLLYKNGLDTIEKNYYLDDHSIFYAVKKSKNLTAKKLSNKLYDKNKKLFINYVNYYNDLIQIINKKIEKLENDKEIYLFGAHVFSQHILANGLNSSKIRGILDNDFKKQGNRLYGTNFKVYSPKILNKIKEPYVIIKAGVYTEEIKEDIINNINPSTIFIE